MPYFFYLASVLGALTVYLMLPNRSSRPGLLQTVLGLATLVGTFWYLINHFGAEASPNLAYYALGAISLIAAVRVITHPRPVYSALYFVMVVLSSAGLLVLLDAEFVAFAMVIIYGGAILITYMFVIMLATLPQSAKKLETAAGYDRQASEPLLSVCAGFLLIAILTGIIFNPKAPEIERAHIKPTPQQMMARVPAKFEGTAVLRRLTQHLREQSNPAIHIDQDESVYNIDIDQGTVEVRRSLGAKTRLVALDSGAINQVIGNIDYVGMALFQGHTLGIELAAVILLLSMVGAIVFARWQIVPMDEVSDDESDDESINA